MKAGQLAKQLGVTPMRIGRVRAQVCADDDYDPKTNDIKPSGIAKIAEVIKPHKEEPDPLEPVYVTFRVTATCPNPQWVYGYDETERPRKKRRCHIPMRMSGLYGSNEKFKAQVIEANGNKFYRHEKCKR